MKEKLLTLILFLSTTTFVFSQNSYPNKLEINSDTIIAITVPQLKQINSLLIDREGLIILNDSLFNEFALLKLNHDKQKRINSLLNKRNSELLIENSDLYVLKRTQEDLSEYYKKEFKIKDRKKTVAFFGGFVVGIAATSTLILILN